MKKEKSMKLRILIAAVLLTAFCAAQTPAPVAPAYSKFEFSVGYDRLWNNVSIADLKNTKQTFLSGLNGVDIGATYNFNQTIGLKADFSANTQSGNFNTSGKSYSFMVGPVVKKHSGKFNPFVELLAGATHQQQNAAIFKIGQSPFTTGQNAFAVVAGGGIDFKLSQHISIRPIEADYVWTAYHADHPTSLLIVSSRQNNFRYVGGMVFTF